MRQMCNLSDLVEERGIQLGMKQGLERGMERGRNYGEASKLVSIVDAFVTKNGVALEKALDMLSVSAGEYEEAKMILFTKGKLNE